MATDENLREIPVRCLTVQTADLCPPERHHQLHPPKLAVIVLMMDNASEKIADARRERHDRSLQIAGDFWFQRLGRFL